MKPAATRRWDDMTPEEREAYVNQDVVKPSWREVPASGFLEALEGEESLADMIGASAPDEAGASILDKLEPVQAICLRLFYCEGWSCGRIAAALAKVYCRDGREIARIRYKTETIRQNLYRGRKALAKLRGRKIKMED